MESFVAETLFCIISPSVMESFFKKDLFIFKRGEGEGEREGEKHHCVVASCVHPTGDLAHNPGMCPDWESNWRPFDLQASAQSTEPYQPGLAMESLRGSEERS